MIATLGTYLVAENLPCILGRELHCGTGASFAAKVLRLQHWERLRYAVNGSEPAGIRTLDTRIKSPML